MRSNKAKLIFLSIIALICLLCFAFYNIQGGFSYAFPRRLTHIGAIVITGAAISYATVMFQTITHNRILTPSMMGVDSVYEVAQTVIFFTAGSASIWVANRYLNFGVAIIMMMAFALLLYRVLFRADRYPVFFLLIAGMIIGTLLGNLVTFMQVMIDPIEYESLQTRLFASFTNVKSELLYISAAILGVAFLYGARIMNDLDVISLGRETAINLGVDYDKRVLNVLILSSVLLAVSTALVGPITFLGLIVSNLAYQYFSTYKHATLIAGASLISVIALVGGQFLAQHVFGFRTTISVIINFVGGIYFIYLLLKESRGTA